jgi:hypothetical protein
MPLPWMMPALQKIISRKRCWVEGERDHAARGLVLREAEACAENDL